MIVESKIVAGNKINPGVSLGLPMGLPEAGTAGDQIFSRNLPGPVLFTGVF
jgi:hypothetical protein